jgi:hypothetical protein
MNKWDIYLQEAKTQAGFAKRSYAAFRDAEKSRSVSEGFPLIPLEFSRPRSE